ncbi:MAG TPA: SDR family oxidoreductase [Candidatus Subteraquimicrobiales bacterium]
MEFKKHGRIIIISSGLGKSGYPGLAAYSASKFGVIGFTESLAYELAKTKIKVFAVLPGGVNTKMHRDIFPEENPNLLLKPERIARIVLTIASTRPLKPSGSSIAVYT